MSKYINADELKDEVIFIENPDGTIEANQVLKAIDEMPSADVVEVVRCKDCTHSIKKNYGGVVSYEYLCALKSSATHLEEHEANYFCADGERKDTE